MSDTPRTESVIKRLDNQDAGHQLKFLEIADHARDLERELAEAKSLKWFSICRAIAEIFNCGVSKEIIDNVKAAQSLISELDKDHAEAKRDLAQACEIAKHLSEWRDKWQQTAGRLEAELAESERLLCDRVVKCGQLTLELADITADRDKEAERINKLEILISRDWIELREDNHQIALLMNFSRIQADDLRAVLDKINI